MSAFLINIIVLGENLLLQEADREVPHKIDENLWKNREQIEEILFLLERSRWPSAVRYIYINEIHSMIFFLVEILAPFNFNDILEWEIYY